MDRARSQAAMRRFLVLFPLCLVSGFALLEVPPVALAVAGFTRALVDVSGALIHLCGGKALVAGSSLISPANGFGVEVENGCNAINVTILLWSAILVFPAHWRAKLEGLAAGTVVLHALNLLRIISLYYLGQYNRRWFEFAHLYLWESFLVLDTLAIFWGWAILARGPVADGDAAAG